MSYKHQFNFEDDVEAVEEPFFKKIETQKDVIDGLFFAAKTIRNLEQELTHLARAFQITGNEKVSDSLYALSDLGDKVSTLITHISGANADLQLKDAYRSTNQVFQAVVAGITVGQRSNEEIAKEVSDVLKYYAEKEKPV